MKEVELFSDGIEFGNVGAADAGRQDRQGIAESEIETWRTAGRGVKEQDRCIRLGDRGLY